MSVVLAGAVALLFAACGGSPPDTTLVVSDDPELAELARELLPDLARRSGLELREPVRLARRSREDLVRYLEAKLDQELPPERARWMTESYALLGLVPDTLELRRILLDVYTEQVAGFYDPDSTALFVMEDQPAENVRTVLVHELVHAVQDQATDLDSLTAPDRGNDRQVAAQAAIEGHATLVMLEYLTEAVRGQPLDLSQVPDFSRQIRPALEALRAQYPALAGAPVVIQESLLFPYLEGAGFVQRLWRTREGRPAPFGSLLPLSTEQVLDPSRLLGDPADPPTALDLRLPAGGRALYANGLGEMELRIFLRTVARSEVPRGPLGWDGDRYVLVEGPEGGRGLVWYSIWDDERARDAFLDRARPALELLPRPVTLEGLTLDGRPGALLRVGDAPDVVARLVEGG